MGCCASKECCASKGCCASKESAELYTAKQNVTVWGYTDKKGKNRQVPEAFHFKKGDEFERVADEGKWWKVRSKKGKKEGWASGGYFASKQMEEEYMKEP